MRRVLVTGASGFIGRRVLALAASSDGEWHATGAGTRPERLSPEVGWHDVDLLAPGAGRDLVSRLRPTHLLHLAWVPTSGGFWHSVDNVRWVERTLGLVQAFGEAGGRRLVCAGTCAEYAWGGPVLAEDTTPLEPATAYGQCKNALRNVLDAYCALQGLEFAWGRVFHLYGADEAPTRLVGSTLRAITAEKPTECGNADRVRDFLHVEDVAAAFVALVGNDALGALNIGSGRATTIREIVEGIATRLGRPDLAVFGTRPSVASEPAAIVADTTRLRRYWTPRYDLDAGLDAVVDEYCRLAGQHGTGA